MALLTAFIGRDERAAPRHAGKVCRRLLRLPLLALLWTLALSPNGWSQTAPSREYELKAAFVFQFMKFVEWPAGSFATTNSPIVLGVIGDSPFGSTLETLLKGEKVDGREIVVSYFPRGSTPGICHVLFISRSEADRVGNILQMVRHQPVLSVADFDNFAARGGMVELFVSDNKVRFRVNQADALEARLRISSKLLRLAEVVRPIR